MKAFLKWAGGKASVFSATAQFFPARFDRYLEPFLGGGAVLLNLAPTNFRVSDVNAPLMNAYIQIRDHLDDLTRTLDQFEQEYSKSTYLRVRSEYNAYSETQSVIQAARFIFLNKTCFNGLYRVNSQGHFNVPSKLGGSPRFSPAGRTAVLGLPPHPGRWASG